MLVILTVIIERPAESSLVGSGGKWVLVYGRRKTGKSFLIENFVKYDDFFFVKRDRSIISVKDGRTIGYEAFLELLKSGLSQGKRVVVDEFHRLGDDFFDSLHAHKKQGKLIIVSSTLFLSRRLFSSRSALLGFFSEAKIGLISIADAAKALKPMHTGRRDLLELAVLAREPLAVDFLEPMLSPREVFAKVLLGSIRTVPALVGEIFLEEERSISAAYEAILRAVANGHVVSGEISSYLFSRNIIKKDDPSIIQQYLNNLADFGIIKKVGVYGKNRFI
ncbi:ATP-binding protein, partial [Candidatus Micrarchaeota archaeon]|nr:ATP-binding protein [Candidatus Micrarchaeota archaeon]